MLAVGFSRRSLYAASWVPNSAQVVAVATARASENRRCLPAAAVMAAAMAVATLKIRLDLPNANPRSRHPLPPHPLTMD